MSEIWLLQVINFSRYIMARKKVKMYTTTNLLVKF